MNLGKITVITPPDTVFNNAISYLLVKPSVTVQQQMHQILSQITENVNVFVFDDEAHDIEWLLNSSTHVDCTIIDVDNCDKVTKSFITFMLAQPNAYYITTDEITPYGLISKNRIYDLNQIIQQLGDPGEEDEDNEDDEQ